jgi:serine/threonine protein phosphatase PrpC
MKINVAYIFIVLQEEKVDSSLEFLILASDGLWDVVSNEVYNDFHFRFFSFW